MRNLVKLIFLNSVLPSLVYYLFYLVVPSNLALFYNIQIMLAFSLVVSIVSISKIQTTKSQIFTISVIKLIVEVLLSEFFSKKNCNYSNVNWLNLTIENLFLFFIAIYYLKAKENIEKNPPPKISNEQSLRRAFNYRMKWYMRIATILIGLCFLCTPILMLFSIFKEMPKDTPIAIFIFFILFAFTSFVLGVLFLPIGILGKYPKFLIRFIAKYDSSLSHIEISSEKK